ncbi:hypothetical protein [Candidatus Kuenenia sp.]|uniref:hypothetical protein n=1 Tax=Candidatus Kuenenia sp. TaxID=2499824 RepID=UPI0032202D06
MAKTLFGIWDLFVIFLLIEGWIGSIKRLVQVTNLNPRRQDACATITFPNSSLWGEYFQFFANIRT